MQQELDRLQLLNQSKDQLFAVVSHDLRAAVFSLQINSSKLKSLLSQQKIKEAMLLAENSVQITTATHSLLNNLLYWALGQTGRLSYHLENVPIKPLINQVCYDFIPIAASRNIAFNITVAKNVSCTCDVNSVKIILRNLIDNAVKYSAANKTIAIYTGEEKGFCSITVKDEGIGMDEQVLQAVFNNGNSRIKQDTQGKRSTGLGLWLARNMAEKNGGRLSIVSKKGTGTSVTLMLLIRDGG